MTYRGEISHAHLYPAQPDLHGLQSVGQTCTLSYREIRSQPETVYENSRSSFPLSPNPVYAAHQDPLPLGQHLAETNPTALLTLDFTVLRCNQALKDALSLCYNIEGRSIKDVLISADRERLPRLQNILRAELQQAIHLPPIRTGPPSSTFDITSATTGFEQRSEYWTFRLPNEQSRGFPISISLARASAYFLILTLVASSKLVVSATASSAQREWPSSQPHVSYPYQQSHRPQSSQGPSSDFSSYRRQSISSQPGHHTSTSSGSNSTVTPRSSLQGEGMKHLQLPPIRTSGLTVSTRSIKESASKGSPQSAKRSKRRRFDVNAMLG